jgi:multimeric flavodoxin WrbA
MRIVAINGSPKPKGNTYLALKTVCDELEKADIEVEIIHVGNMNINGCISCGRCKDGHCVHSDDKMKEIVEKIYATDGLILGSPVYYSAIAGNLKCFLDRLFYASQGRLRLKIGASIAVLRRSGGVATFDQLNHYFLISEMLIAPSFYWNAIHGRTPGEIMEDAEGISVLQNLAQNMAWMLKIKDCTKDTLPVPPPVKREWTNFIR